MVKVKRKKWIPQKFFKVFLPNSSSHYMKFPLAFLKRFKRNTPFKSTIITPNKNSWKVHVDKMSDNLYFREGWEQFVHHNVLELGDFLVFSYDGNSIFHVRIFGRNGCEKESAYHHVESHGLAFQDENPIDETGKCEGIDYVEISKKFEKVNRDFKEVSDFASDFPFFKVVMKLSYISQGYTMIPIDFAKRHMENVGQCTRSTLLFCNKSWPVKLLRYSIYCRFARGWHEFVKDTALEKGDICMFELVDETDHVFNVSIFRCSK